MLYKNKVDRRMRIFKWLLLLAASTTFVESINRGINFYGLETPSKKLVCTWENPVSYYIDKLHDLGFNSIRLPFSLQYVREGNFSQMDELFSSIQKYPNMKIVLDMHRVFSSHQGPVPTDGGTTMVQFLDGWCTIIERYIQNPQFVGIDVFNEYQGTDNKYWNNILRTIVTHIEHKYPNRFTYFVGGTHWGGSLNGINIEDLPFHDRIKYTIHKYVFSTSGNSRDVDWNYSFGDLKDIPGKISVGEWGFISDKPNEVQWAKEFVEYLKKHNIHDNFFWTIAHSGDTGGLWKDDCINIDMDKYEIIKSLWVHEPKKNLRLRDP